MAMLLRKHGPVLSYPRIQSSSHPLPFPLVANDPLIVTPLPSHTGGRATHLKETTLSSPLGEFC